MNNDTKLKLALVGVLAARSFIQAPSAQAQFPGCTQIQGYCTTKICNICEFDHFGSWSCGGGGGFYTSHCTCPMTTCYY